MKRRFLAMLLSVAMVLTMLPVTAFAADPAGSDGIVSLAALEESLNVRAIKSAGDEPTITLKVTPKADSSGTSTAAEGGETYYYETADTSGNLTSLEESSTITTGNGATWKEYTGPFSANGVGKVQVVTVTSTTTNETTTLTVAKCGKTETIADELGTLTVSVDDKNVITAKKGDSTTLTNPKYYALAADKLDAFNTAKADWASDTALTALASDLGLTEISVTEGTSASITKGESGKYIVVVETDGSDPNTTITSLGVTEQVAKFVKPFKLFLGEPTDTTTATDVIADIEEADSTYTVTVPVDTEKLTVSGTGVTVTQGTSTTVNKSVVELDAAASSHTFTVKEGTDPGAVEYSITVARVLPSLKNADNDLITSSTRNGNEFTCSDQLTNDVSFLTLSVPENDLNLSLSSASVTYAATGATATVSGGKVYLKDGLNTITVTFSDNSTCTIKVTRKAADPGVALYAGATAEGDDLLADLEESADKTYTVTVPSTTTQVTVGATAGTIASVSYTVGDSETPTTSTNKVVPVTSAGVTITVKFNDDADNPTTFTITVNQSAAFVNLTVAEGTGDKAGKVVVTAPTPVPADLRVVVLSKDPAWTETTAASKVATDIVGAIESDATYTDGAKAIPAAGESDQYVVVYKTDGKFVTHYGVYTVAKVDRKLTVKDSSNADAESMITFDPAVHEYTVSVDQSVTGVKIEALPGDTVISVSSNSTMSNGVVQKLTVGGVSTVTVEYMNVSPTASYTIKLVWPMHPDSISNNDQKVTVAPSVSETGEAAADLTENEDDVLKAISTTSVANKDENKDNPVQITATTSGSSAEETTVTLPASAAELLQDTGIDAKVVTDAGEVTIPSEAIAQTQPGTEDSPAAPVAIAVVVAKKEVAAPTEGGIVEAAKFEVTVKKADADGVMEATNITDLQKPITLVFKVLKTTIGEMKNPRLAHVKTEGGKTTYEKLTNAAPTESGDYYVFTEKTSHLSEFAVVAEEATTEPEPTGPNITDITMENVDDFTFNSSATEPFEVTAKPEAKEVSITVTADNYTNVVVSTSGAGETTGDSSCDGKTPVKFTLSNEGKATIYVKVNGTVKYTINVSKEADPTVKEITNIKLTDKTGTTSVENFTFAKTTYEYPNVVTDITPVLVTVEGDTANVTVNEKSYTAPVEVVPTADGTKVTIAYGDGTAQKYEITLKTKSTTPPVEETVTIAIGTVVTMLNEGENTPALDAKVGDTITVSPETATVKDGANPVTLGTGGILTLAAGPHNLVITVDGKDYKITVNVAEDGDEPVTPTTPVTDDKITVGGTDETIKFDTDKEDPTKQTANVEVASGGSSISFKAASGATVTLTKKDGTPGAVKQDPDGTVTATVEPGDTIQIVSADGKTTYVMKFTEDTTSAANLTVTAEAISAGDENPFQKLKVQSPRTNHRYVFKVEFKSTADSKLGVFTMTAGEDGSIIVKTDPDGYKVSVYEFSGTNDMIVNGSVTENNRTGVNINQNVAVTGK